MKITKSIQKQILKKFSFTEKFSISKNPHFSPKFRHLSCILNLKKIPVFEKNSGIFLKNPVFQKNQGFQKNQRFQKKIRDFKKIPVFQKNSGIFKKPCFSKKKIRDFKKTLFFKKHPILQKTPYPSKNP